MSTTNTKLRAAVLIVSQTASEDPLTDKCIPILQDVFRDLGNDQWDVAISEIVPDSFLEIQKFITTWSDGKDGKDAVNLIVTSGGTGFAVKDVTPEVWLSESWWGTWKLMVDRLFLRCWIDRRRGLCEYHRYNYILNYADKCAAMEC